MIGGCPVAVRVACPSCELDDDGGDGDDPDDFSVRDPDSCIGKKYA